jgi:hypothetical protein
MTKTRAKSPAPLKSLYEGAAAAVEKAPLKSLYENQRPVSNKPPKKRGPGQRSECGTCKHSKRHHRETAEVTYQPLRVLSGAGRCRYGVGSVSPCTCEAFMASPSAAKTYPKTITFNLHPEDMAFVDATRSLDGKNKVSLCEILALVATTGMGSLSPAIGVRMGSKEPKLGTPQVNVDAVLVPHSEQPATEEERATIYDCFARDLASGAKRIDATTVRNGLLMYYFWQARLAREGFVDDGYDLHGTSMLLHTNRGEFERIKTALAGAMP